MVRGAGRPSCVDRRLCPDPDRQRLSVCRPRELVAAASVDCHSLPFRGAAQLVRSALFSDAFAGTVWSLSKFLSRGVCGHRPADLRLRFVAGTLLPEGLVRCELGQRHWVVEHADDPLDRLTGPDARQTESKSRLVLGPANRVCLVRLQLAVTRAV